MKFDDLVKFILTVLLMGATIALAAFDPVNDDTDIFLANPNNTAQRPNVLIVLDNTANWNQPFDNEKAALVSVVNGLTDQYNVGLMMFPETGGDNDSVDGGYVRYHVRRMTDTNKTALSTMVNNLDKIVDKGNNATTGLALHEAFLYFGGRTSIAGHGKVKTDKVGTTDPLLSPLTGHALPEGATPAKNSTAASYTSPVTDGCQRSFVIYISNGPANENAAARADLQGKLQTLTGVTPPAVIGITPDGQQSNWADEMARFMANADVFATSGGVPNSSGVQNVYTYTVEIDPDAGANIINVTTSAAHGFAVNDPVIISGTTNFNGTYTVNTVTSTTQFTILATISPSPATESAGTAAVGASSKTISAISQTSSDMTALLKSMAANGKGKYFGVSSGGTGTAIVDALNKIFAEVQAVNSVFAATTLPVSVNVRGTNLNQVYIGVFRPDPNKAPRWLGNLKMYNLALNSVTGTVFLADATNGPPPATGAQAENSTTGFISQNAVSFWTVNNPATYWSWRTADQNGPGGGSDKPDGDLVEKGGAAQQLRLAFPTSQNARNLYTCTTGSFANCVAASGVTPGSLLSGTPFSTANTDITDGSLGISAIQSVIALSALVGKSVTALTDRRTLEAISNAANPVTVTLANGTPNDRTASTVSNLGPAKTINTLHGFNDPKTISNISYTPGPGNDPDFINVTTSTAHGLAANDSVRIAGTSKYNGTYTVQALDGTNPTTKFTIESTINPSPDPETTGTASGKSFTALATTSAAHGLSVNDQVQIAGATPSDFNGDFTVTAVPSTTTFNYALPTKQGSATLSSATVKPRLTTVTITTTANHGYVTGQQVRITGGSPAGYNGTYVISSVPTSTQFTYITPTVVAPNNTGTVTITSGSSTTVTATAGAAHGFTNGQSLSVSGASPSSYNGTYTIACTPTPACAGATTFTFTTGSILAPATASALATGAGDTSATVTATLTNHGYTGLETITIAGASPAEHNGTFTVVTAPTANTFTYSTVTALAAPTGTITVQDSPIRAFVTAPGHGYSNLDAVTIKGAVPTGYNGLFTIANVTTDTFTYTVGSALGPASGTITANKPGTTATATVPAHGYTVGQPVTIAGANEAAFNGAISIATVPTLSTFTYGPLSSAQGDATGSITATAASTGNNRNVLIRWVRGEDNLEDENSNASTTDIRASVHGDVLHSRPAVINYNRYGSDNDVYIFYGANDGIFRAVKGGYASDAAETLPPGNEAWGFVPKEFFGNLKRIRDNSPIVSSANKKRYFADGPIGIYTRDGDGTTAANDKLGDAADKVNLYIAMRRGGRVLYALDVNDPKAPRFLWKKGCPNLNNNTGCDTNFSELGQTWSQPTVVTGLAGLADPVLVFGAGYDPDPEDVDPKLIHSIASNGDVCLSATCTTATNSRKVRTMGRGIFVVNALTGDLIWSAGKFVGATKNVTDMHYAIPSDVTVIRNESESGNTNRAYVGDTGGQLWRIDFKSDPDLASPNLAFTTVTKLASIADTTTTASFTDTETDPATTRTVLPGLRKFLFPPDVVGQTGFDAVLIGSGDREHPFNTTVENRFYMFKDKGDDAGAKTGAQTCDPTIIEGPQTADASCTPVTTISGMSDLTSNCIQDAAACAAAGEVQDTVKAKLGTDRGWFIKLLSGEKVIGNAISIGGTTFFNTNQPSSTAGGGTCGSNLGVARQYQVATADATATSDLNAVGGLTGADRSLVHAGGGYLPSPVHVVVMLGGQPVEAVISGVQVSTPAGATLSARLRKFWYKEVDPK